MKQLRLLKNKKKASLSNVIDAKKLIIEILMQPSIYLNDLKKVSDGRLMIVFLEEKGGNLKLK